MGGISCHVTQLSLNSWKEKGKNQKTPKVPTSWNTWEPQNVPIPIPLRFSGQASLTPLSYHDPKRPRQALFWHGEMCLSSPHRFDTISGSKELNGKNYSSWFKIVKYSQMEKS